MTAPPGILFVEADEPVLVFASVADAEACLEASDVADGVYPSAYGRHGEPYRLVVDGTRVVIEKIRGAKRPDELKELLLRYFEACEDPADQEEPLGALVDRAWSIESDYRSRCGSPNERDRFRMPMWGYLALILVPAAILYWALS